jgi:carbamoyltransferase
MLFIGMTIGHDASVAIAESSGRILFAAGEERFSRQKNHLGSPFLAFEYAKQHVPLTSSDLANSIVTIGTTFSKKESWFLAMLLSRSHQRNYDIFNNGFPPGLLKSLLKETSVLNFNHQEMVAQAFGFNPNQIFFLNHHDSHASSAFWPSLSEKSAVITLDGSGDGESGTISVMNRMGEKQVVYRIPERYSLGHLYSEVTKKYGFKESRHEGKITGLAAYTNKTSSTRHLESLLKCKKGRLQFGKRYVLDVRNRDRLEFWKLPNHRKAFSHAVSRMESDTESYPELARGVQTFLESTINQLILQSNVLKEVNSISVAGGVFSNVTLNRSIRNSFPEYNFYVFPNMGDGGLSVGSIWEFMRLRRLRITDDCMNNMYQGFNPEPSTISVNRIEISPAMVADFILNEKVVGVVYGEMEFGPRALCHRSIIASPKRKEINTILNLRLNRTEFMPFAPVVRDIDFDKIFELNDSNSQNRLVSDVRNFSFMTETCLVRQHWIARLPAIVHEDRTARPQILRYKDNPLVYETLGILSEKHEIPVLINTSFNAHEEPIILNEEQAINELRKGRIDVLVSGFSQLTVEE